MTHHLNLKIQDCLTRLNGSMFQSLCDDYICYKFYKKIRLFNKEGSQRIKDKTIAGTPDTLFFIDNDVVFVESTTKEDGLVKKLKSDIDACLDYKKTPFHSNEITKIVLCYNSNLNSEEIKKIEDYAKEISIIHINNDLLTNDICYYQPWLAEKYLGISDITNEVFSVTRFVEKYNESAKKFSYPLDNAFRFRENEISQVSDSISSNTITIINGASGVGKTRLATKVVLDYSTRNKFRSLAIRSLTEKVVGELNIVLSEPDTKFILFFDDANVSITNRILLCNLLDDHPNNVKVVMTVKDQSYECVRSAFKEYNLYTISLSPFTSSEIEDIISSEPFNIDLFTIKTHISQLAAGNVRLAAMMAVVAQKNGYGRMVESIEELYDVYFEDQFKDVEENELKILSILSIFRSLEFCNEDTNKLLQQTSVDSSKIIQALNSLDRKDFIETRCSSNIIIARISDQNIAAYAFRNFVAKRQIVPIDNLFRCYYKQYHRLFQEAIYQANYIPHDDVVYNFTRNLLNPYLTNPEDETIEKTIYKDFGYFIPDEAMAYWNNQVCKEPFCDNEIIVTTYTTNQFSFHQDEIITSLLRFLPLGKQYCECALSLMLDYCHRNYKHIPEVVFRLKKNTAYEPIDVEHGLHMMDNIVNFFIHKSESDIVAKHIFIALADSYLGIEAHHNYTRGKNFTTTLFKLIGMDCIVSIRKRIWQHIFTLHKELPSEALSSINNYLNNMCRGNRDVVSADLEELFPFMEKSLKPDSFSDTLLAHRIIDGCEEYLQISIEDVKETFNTDIYNIYQELLFCRKYYDYDIDKFVEIKKERYPEIIPIDNENDVKLLLDKVLRVLVSVKIKDIAYGLVVLIEMLMQKNITLGISMFKTFLTEIPSLVDKSYLYRIFYYLSSTEYYLNIEDFVMHIKCGKSTSLQLEYFRYLPENQVIDRHRCMLVETIKRTQQEICYVDIRQYYKICSEAELLDAILEANSKESCKVKLISNFYPQNGIDISDIDLYKQTYLQQITLDSSFDFYNKFIEVLYKLDPSIVVNLLRDYIFTGKVTLEHGMSFLFKDGYDESLLFQLFDMICDNYFDYRSYREMSFDILYVNIDVKYSTNVQTILEDYFTLNIDNYQTVSLLFASVNSLYPALYEKLVLRYIDNKEPDDFMKVDWHPCRSESISGRMTFGDVDKQRWANLLSIVEKSDKYFKVLMIRSKINEMIKQAEESARKEQNSIFMRGE